MYIKPSSPTKEFIKIKLQKKLGLTLKNLVALKFWVNST